MRQVSIVTKQHATIYMYVGLCMHCAAHANVRCMYATMQVVII